MAKGSHQRRRKITHSADASAPEPSTSTERTDVPLPSAGPIPTSGATRLPRFFADQMAVLGAAVKAVPAVKYALGVAGIAAAWSLVLYFVGTLENAPVVIGLMFVFMIALVFFSKIASLARPDFRIPALVAVWAILVLGMLFGVVAFASYAFGWPSKARVGVVSDFLPQHKPETVALKPGEAKYWGGPRGTEFSSSCGEGLVLRGVRGKKGLFIYNATPECGSLVRTPGGGVQLRPAPAGQTIGITSYGQDWEIMCPADQMVIAVRPGVVEYDDGKFVGGVRLICGLVAEVLSNSVPHGTVEKTFSAQVGVQWGPSFSCSQGAANTLVGRAGDWVDALGIQCAVVSLE